MKVLTRITALLVLAVLVFLVLELPVFWQPFYPVKYEEFIARQARANNLDPALVAAVIKVESNFRHDAVSRADARGLMQIRPDTAREVARELGHVIDEDVFEELLFDPEYNITLGTRYLAKMLQEFGGNEAMALAAYNAGPARLRSWLEKGIWDGTWKNRTQIPYPETRNYLRKVELARERYARLYNFK
ncbi:MAG: lytic transglycosylase domain-containing protein [Firmicutes bacterium]|nr:lytic transglycosylase domain-containing protein [Bacillota bacterium]